MQDVPPESDLPPIGYDTVVSALIAGTLEQGFYRAVERLARVAPKAATQLLDELARDHAAILIEAAERAPEPREVWRAAVGQASRSLDGMLAEARSRTGSR